MTDLQTLAIVTALAGIAAAIFGAEVAAVILFVVAQLLLLPGAVPAPRRPTTREDSP